VRTHTPQRDVLYDTLAQWFDKHAMKADPDRHCPVLRFPAGTKAHDVMRALQPSLNLSGYTDRQVWAGIGLTLEARFWDLASHDDEAAQHWLLYGQHVAWRRTHGANRREPILLSSLLDHVMNEDSITVEVYGQGWVEVMA
jgi:hypothetical protein